MHDNTPPRTHHVGDVQIPVEGEKEGEQRRRRAAFSRTGSRGAAAEAQWGQPHRRVDTLTCQNATARHRGHLSACLTVAAPTSIYARCGSPLCLRRDTTRRQAHPPQATSLPSGHPAVATMAARRRSSCRLLAAAALLVLCAAFCRAQSKSGAGSSGHGPLRHLPAECCCCCGCWWQWRL